MLRGHAISDADWGRIQHLLPGRPGQHGGAARDNRLLLDAALYVARTGVPWADRPGRLGNRSSQWRRFDRRAEAGRWDPILAALRDPGLDALILDPAAARAHPRAAGAGKNMTAPAASPSRRRAAAGAGSAPKSAAASAGWGTPPSCS